MKTYTNLLRLDMDYPTIAANVRKMLDMCTDEELTADFAWLIGGDFTRLDTVSEWDQMKEDHGEQPDIVDVSVEGIVQIVYITNNSGGPTYIVKADDYWRWLATEEPACQEQFHSVQLGG